MSDYTPSLATAREVFIDGAQGEFVGEDFDRMIAQVRDAALREFASAYRARYSAGYVLTSHAADLADERADRIEKEAGL